VQHRESAIRVAFPNQWISEGDSTVCREALKITE